MISSRSLPPNWTNADGPPPHQGILDLRVHRIVLPTATDQGISGSQVCMLPASMYAPGKYVCSRQVCMLPSALDQYHQLEQVKYHTFRKLLYASAASSPFLKIMVQYYAAPSFRAGTGGIGGLNHGNWWGSRLCFGGLPSDR